MMTDPTKEREARKRVKQFVQRLKKTNKQSERSGAPPIPEAEYRELSETLFSQIAKRVEL